MKNFKGNSGKNIWKTIVLPIVICIAMLAIMVFVVLMLLTIVGCIVKGVIDLRKN